MEPDGKVAAEHQQGRGEGIFGVTGGTRIRNLLGHNQALYHLSYGHMVRCTGVEPVTPA